MNSALLRALIAMMPVSLLFCGSIVLLFKSKTAPSFLQVLGAGALVMVILVHFCEALHLLLWMRWGLQNSPGHYVDLSSAILAATLFPIGYLLHAMKVT